MLVKSIAAGLAASALLVTVASAQTSTSTTNAASNSTNMSTLSEQSLRGDWRTSKVVGLSVYNDNNESIGSIDDLLTDKSGNIKAVVLGVGGFLGVGEHLVAVPFEKIKFSDQPVSSTTSSNSSTSRPASTTTTGAANSTSSSSMSSSSANAWYPDHAVFNATKDELKAMPEFKFSS